MENEYDPKYQEGKIYKIVCNITGEVYYGSTISKLSKRINIHKNLKDCVSRNIINRGDYKIELIKDYPCNSQYELEEEEGKYIRENECINKQIPGRTKKEHYEDNKIEIVEKNKQYRDLHKEEINKKKLEKITCECGAIVAKAGLARHKKTMNHIKKTECIIID